MQLTFYIDRFWISPFVFSVWMTLKEKGLPFEVVELALDRQETRTPDFRARSLTAKVPALEHDGFWLAESLAIIEYLEERFPPPAYARVLPADIQQRARARQVLSWLRTDLVDLRRERPTTSMFYQPANQPLGPDAQAAADRLVDIAGRLIPDGATSLFDSWCLADSDLAFMLGRLALSGHELPAGLRAFFDAQWARPLVSEFAGRARPAYVEY